MFGERQIPYGERVGVLIGRGNEPHTLRAAVAFSETQKAPILGEFLVVEETELRKRRLLCRVDDVTYGDFHTTQDERERTLVEKYIRDISGHERPLSEEEKSMLFFQHYILRVLGEFRTDEKSERIATDYRYLPTLTALLRYPRKEELETLTTAGLPHAKQLPAVGHLSFGESEVKDVLIRFDVSRFVAKRTAIFARTGYGKSNLAKFVVALAGITAPEAGMIVLDLEGEYAFSTTKEKGSVVYGLADIPHLQDRLVVFTKRRISQTPVDVRPMINLARTEPFWVRSLIPISEQETATARVFANILNVCASEWKELIKFVEEHPGDWQGRNEKIDKFIEAALRGGETQKQGQRPAKGLIDPGQANVLRRIIEGLLVLHDSEGMDFFKEVQEALRDRKLVVLDLSLYPLDSAMQIANVVLGRIFNFNQYRIISGGMVPVIAVFEEAQNVLSKKAVEEGRTIFVRWAKEGRKYNLGLIYITQQPGAVAEEIVSQTDNFFVMHLLGKNDVDALVRANRHYDGVIAHFLTSETVVGNAYIYSAPYQPFVFPAHIWEFRPEIFERLFGEPPAKQKQAVQPIAETIRAPRQTGGEPPAKQKQVAQPRLV